MTRDLRWPIPTCPQGLTSKTFKPPPMAPYMNLPNIFDWHLQNSPQHPFYVYSKGANSKDNSITTVTWGEAVKIIYRIAGIVSTAVGPEKENAPKPLVGMYCSLESLTYMLTAMGVICAGYTVILLSDKASPATLEHLIVESGVAHILTNADDEILASRLSNVREKLKHGVTVSTIPSWSEISGEGETCSTALPELNRWTHGMIYNLMWSPWFGDREICGEIMSTCSIPMGGLSVLMQTLLGACSGLITAGFPPLNRKPEPTLENVWNTLIVTGSTFGYLPLPYLAVWSEQDDKVQRLSELKGVLFAGAPLSKEVGDKLAAKGVNLISFYGSSEAGQIVRAFRHKHAGMNWEWFEFNPLINPSLRNVSEDGVGELVLKFGPTHRATRSNCTVDDLPAYATGDILEPHPTIPRLWRYVSRVSDQETIGANGPKVNVVAMGKKFF
ncbi:Adenylate-forming reductase Nps10 [Psilocybe cubensis]|uniref:Adenylate-forming reductase Nps10 n=1 Tax=Psilocybe cubensis TaxID=181762 RepID=A0ACB8GHZ5_PSICU|nr:Adenylate-forming reductase Nps10 [Psilocybe cubensis]KAH9474694.1 Adenylate-forming reductase Nps10 [Psilocybe cubensis]